MQMTRSRSIFPLSWKHTSTSVRAHRSAMHARAVVRMRFQLATFKLDEHAHDKFIRLLGGYKSPMYDRASDMVTLETDRCPSRKQNSDFLMYALQVLFSEARKTEKWETTERTADDYPTFQFQLSRSFRIVADFLQRSQGDGMGVPRRGDSELSVSSESPSSADTKQNEESRRDSSRSQNMARRSYR